VEASHIKVILEVLEKCGKLKFSILIYANGICDKWVKNFANKVSDKGYYFYEPRKTCSVKPLHSSGLVLTAYIKSVSSFVSCQTHGGWDTN
jgi:hypothetical protein